MIIVSIWHKIWASQYRVNDSIKHACPLTAGSLWINGKKKRQMTFNNAWSQRLRIVRYEIKLRVFIGLYNCRHYFTKVRKAIFQGVIFNSKVWQNGRPERLAGMSIYESIECGKGGEAETEKDLVKDRKVSEINRKHWDKLEEWHQWSWRT